MELNKFFENLNNGARWDVGVSINRSNALPLDANSVFSSKTAAENYAKGIVAEGQLANAYPGMLLSVVEDTETIIYYIDANMDLQPVGNTRDVMTYIGNIPEDAEAETIIEYINAKTEGIATDTALKELQTALNNIKDIVEGTEEEAGLVDAVAANTTAIENITKAETGAIAVAVAAEAKARDAAIDEAKRSILGENVAEAYDTLKEIQDILTGTDGEAIDGVIEGIAANKAAIAVLNGNANTAGSVDKKIATAIEPIATTYATKEELSSHVDTADEKYATKQFVGAIPNDYTESTVIAYVNKKAQEVLEAATGGSTESAASVKLQLDNYKAANDPKVDALLSEVYGPIPDGNEVHDYTAASRIDSNALAISLNTQNISNLNLAINGDEKTDGIVKKLSALETEVGTVTNSRIDALEGAVGQHTADIAKNTSAVSTLNTTTIPALQQDIAAGDKAITDVIGDVESGKTVVDMINAVADTIDFTPYAKVVDLEAIYKPAEGENEATGLLAEAIADIEANAQTISTTAEELSTLNEVVAVQTSVINNNTTKIDANTDAIAVLNGDDQTEGSVDYKVAQEVAKILNDNDSSDIDTLNEIAAWITNDTTGVAKMNADIAANTSAIEALPNVYETKANVKVVSDAVATLNGDVDTAGSVLAMIAAAAPSIATTTINGLVKSVAATVENGVSVATDGTMSVNSLNINKLVQTSGDVLVLNGGGASVSTTE